MNNMYNEKKVAGLWIDHEIAQIITANDDGNEETFEVVKKIKSNIHGSFGSSQNANSNKPGLCIRINERGCMIFNFT